MSAKRICVEKDQQTPDDGDKDQRVVINLLDCDSLAKIFMLLPIPERIDMEEVCAKWKEACQLAWYDIKKYKCESSIGRSYDNRLLTQSYLEKILLRCGIYLKELSFSDACNSNIMPFVGDHCKNLTSLECEFNVDSLTHNADHFVQAFTQLNKLKFIKIILEHESQDQTVNLLEIINSFPKEMNEIHLLRKFLSIYKLTVSMTLKKFKNLQKMTLRGLFLDDIILQEIAEKTTLVYLDIRLYEIAEGFCLFNKLVNLEYIDLTMGRTTSICIVTKNLYTKVINTIFCACKKLKHLDIPYGLYDVNKIPSKNWINFQNLEYLGFYCNITPDLANTIVKYCKNLKHLRIHNPHRIMNDTALKKLTELENLECLLLVGDVKITEESIIAISNNCKKLKRLEMPHFIIVPSIVGDPLSSPSVLDELSKLQYLEHLNLSIAKNIEDSTVIAITNNCKNLKSLDIGGCTAVTETALVALTNLENLQKLNIGFLDISDSFIIKLKGLKKLNCLDCKKLTDAGIIQLIKNNPDLEDIGLSYVDNITINTVIAANQATKNRTNGVILYLNIFNPSITEASKSIIKSQWLVVK
ncbi:uncharacterized protein LOC122847388 [Aphidius gifuensis]|uniref:uncharacterized protein LOC122847388 n=1 Tax=Aphidius gifuensis TaxID=684658 RepID=UPI001CDB664C|nr:uncharacterized protein LOC122847388 [Aphidius gifuensis]